MATNFAQALRQTIQIRDLHFYLSNPVVFLNGSSIEMKKILTSSLVIGTLLPVSLLHSPTTYAGTIDQSRSSSLTASDSTESSLSCGSETATPCIASQCQPPINDRHSEAIALVTRLLNTGEFNQITNLKLNAKPDAVSSKLKSEVLEIANWTKLALANGSETEMSVQCAPLGAGAAVAALGVLGVVLTHLDTNNTRTGADVKIESTKRLAPESGGKTPKRIAVPTPALLPGLVGIAIATFRKRRNAELSR